jgi:hypothetical protein
MGLLEIYFGTIAIIVIFIAFARGYAKELGSTMIIMVSIFLLLFVEEQFQPALVGIGNLILPNVEGDLLLSLFYQIFFISSVFAGYAGRTINFAGAERPPPQGTILTLLIGLLNGYLIAGSLWYYQNQFFYPIWDLLGVPATTFITPSSLQVIELLPQYLLSQPTLWMIPIALLLLLKVRG